MTDPLDPGWAEAFSRVVDEASKAAGELPGLAVSDVTLFNVRWDSLTERERNHAAFFLALRVACLMEDGS
jgi:hypothetical protein